MFDVVCELFVEVFSSAFCLSVIAVLLSKVMVMFGVCGVFLRARPFNVFQSV